MKYRDRNITLWAVAFWTLWQPLALAHHSAAAFDTSKESTITGTVVEYSFRNPHVYMTVAVPKPDGTTVLTEIEAGAGSVIGPLGFTRDAIKVGDVVNVVGNPGRRDPQGLMLGKELYKQDGSYLPLHIGSRSLYEDGDATADSFTGTWFPPRTWFYGVLGAANEWPLSPQGRAARDSADPFATPQKDCIPLGVPALMFYPVANTLTLYPDRLEMNIDWLESRRTVWLDGREHPPAAQRWQHGHSVGHWEGNVLVIESTNFTENAIGLSTTIPSGIGKRVVERLQLSEDRKRMLVHTRVEDPEYLTAPAEYAGEWLYRPGMQHSNERCDLDVARRFLDD